MQRDVRLENFADLIAVANEYSPNEASTIIETEFQNIVFCKALLDDKQFDPEELRTVLAKVNFKPRPIYLDMFTYLKEFQFMLEIDDDDYIKEQKEKLEEGYNNYYSDVEKIKQVNLVERRADLLTAQLAHMLATERMTFLSKESDEKNLQENLNNLIGVYNFLIEKLIMISNDQLNEEEITEVTNKDSTFLDNTSSLPPLAANEKGKEKVKENETEPEIATKEPLQYQPERNIDDEVFKKNLALAKKLSLQSLKQERSNSEAEEGHRQHKDYQKENEKSAPKQDAPDKKIIEIQEYYKNLLESQLTQAKSAVMFPPSPSTSRVSQSPLNVIFLSEEEQEIEAIKRSLADLDLDKDKDESEEKCNFKM